MNSWRFVSLVALGWSLPWLPAEAVDFHKEVAPILARSCVKCHTGAQAKGGLRLETRELLLQGGDSGAVIVAGKPDESYLIELVSGTDKDRVMPAQGPRLTSSQVAILRDWIGGGLAWETGFRFSSASAAPLAPRRPELPATSPDGSANPIDLMLQRYFQEHDVTTAEVVSDRVFARRVYLDLNGLLPPPADLEAFVRDTSLEKRALLVQRLLDDRTAYADHWMTFWNDLLRNAYRGTGFIDGGRIQISGWLYQSLYEAKPYDQFVHELISPVPGSEGFTKGIVWRGVVNASQRPEMQAAQNVAQVFMGTNLKCASCHDSFVNDWKLKESYALAAVFAAGDLEIHRCNKPTGEMAQVGFIYPELGLIGAGLPRGERMKQLADLVISPRNGRLGRTMVNRLWAWTMGRGIVEPLDDLDQYAWHQDLLDWLAADFQDHGYDIKRTLQVICTSRAYQLPSVGAPRPDQQDFVFRGPLVRRMTAEQFADAVATLTGVWPAKATFQPARTDAAPRSIDGRLTDSLRRQLDVAGGASVGIRTALVNDDALTRALGRPNREQVVTRRDTLATTLQALELTNGDTLDGVLAKGARHWSRQAKGAPPTLIPELYLQALGRPPTEVETAIAEQLMAGQPDEAALHDVLWILTMLPEFQLIY